MSTKDHQKQPIRSNWINQPELEELIETILYIVRWSWSCCWPKMDGSRLPNKQLKPSASGKSDHGNYEYGARSEVTSETERRENKTRYGARQRTRQTSSMLSMNSHIALWSLLTPKRNSWSMQLSQWILCIKKVWRRCKKNLTKGEMISWWILQMRHPKLFCA